MMGAMFGNAWGDGARAPGLTPTLSFRVMRALSTVVSCRARFGRRDAAAPPPAAFGHTSATARSGGATALRFTATLGPAALLDVREAARLSACALARLELEAQPAARLVGAWLETVPRLVALLAAVVARRLLALARGVADRAASVARRPGGALLRCGALATSLAKPRLLRRRALAAPALASEALLREEALLGGGEGEAASAVDDESHLSACAASENAAVDMREPAAGAGAACSAVDGAASTAASVAALSGSAIRVGLLLVSSRSVPALPAFRFVFLSLEDASTPRAPASPASSAHRVCFCFLRARVDSSLPALFNAFPFFSALQAPASTMGDLARPPRPRPSTIQPYLF
eukprot:CAMPEP_0119362186 /NCGR_PEP_ID=MMETSP1334-20130426/9318_1 /TAXON_ID=127549 /ORGANISM="Calcidiscus leptoporus, Strain RCC1130" /LENGTH=348 /DNA_ID=CAMNT_0007377363 /DNA_START=252 /DNA_END=1297 /DNA_ORIENTATION=-